MRLFTAIELPEDVRHELAGWQEVLRKSLRGKISWTNPQNLHVTLKFIGEVDNPRAESIRLVLREIEGIAPMRISITSLMLLPPRGPTRVIGADAKGDLSELFRRIEAALEACGIARERRAFRAHITLGRVRKRTRIAIEHIELPKPRRLEFEAHEFVLLESTLSQTGSRYDVIERFPLARG
jgi:2'-5' RNA ligase